MPDQDFPPELVSALERAKAVVNDGETCVIILEDMVAINDHFQAILDWFKDQPDGTRKFRRYGTGCFAPNGGVLYFVGADTHLVGTRGAALELDLQPFQEHLVRKTGLEARLREKGLA